MRDGWLLVCLVQRGDCGGQTDGWATAWREERRGRQTHHQDEKLSDKRPLTHCVAGARRGKWIASNTVM